MTDPLTDQEKNILLRLAREAMEDRVKGKNFLHWITIRSPRNCVRMARPL